MAEEQGKSSSGFKIEDRRRFDMQGNERQVAGTLEKEAEVSAGSPAGGKMEKNNGLKAAPQEEKPLPPINFSSFVISLATQALMQLGQVKPPAGVDINVDRAAAKQTIDLLSMLEEKTKGNLDEEEVRLLSEVLHNLRLSFVKAV